MPPRNSTDATGTSPGISGARCEVNMGLRVEKVGRSAVKDAKTGSFPLYLVYVVCSSASPRSRGTSRTKHEFRGKIKPFQAETAE